MITWKTIFPAAVAALAIAGTGMAQEVNQFSPAPQAQGQVVYPTAGAVAGCATCGQTECGCGTGLAGGGFGGHLDHWRAKIHHNSVLNAKKYARNDAWPKPFACWDRRAYHEFWTPYLESGKVQHGILSADFFDPETNELTPIGINRIAGIMQSVAEEDRAVYVQRVADDQTNRARMQAVKNTIDTYYAHFGLTRVDLTNRAPSMVNGRYSESIANKRIDSLAAPVIDIGRGGSINAAVSGNN